MKYLGIVIALASCRCTTQPQEPQAPSVQIVAVDPMDPDLPEYVLAAQAWAPLGFEISDHATQPAECDPLWHVEMQTDCQITIHVERDPHTVEKFGARGYSQWTKYDNRHIWIDTSVGRTYEMRRIMAHESGHILLDTSTHTIGGIMGGANWVMEQVDYDLACTSIGICRGPAS